MHDRRKSQVGRGHSRHVVREIIRHEIDADIKMNIEFLNMTYKMNGFYLHKKCCGYRSNGKYWILKGSFQTTLSTVGKRYERPKKSASSGMLKFRRNSK